MSSFLLAALVAAAPAAAQAPADTGLPLKILPQQSLPESGCALFLWQAGTERRLILMARTDNASARVSVERGIVDLAATAVDGANVGGFAPRARFSDGTLTLDWQLRIEERPDVTDGAVVSSGTLNVAQAAGDQAVIPVTGLIGCRPTP